MGLLKSKNSSTHKSSSSRVALHPIGQLSMLGYLILLFLVMFVIFTENNDPFKKHEEL